jgi:signal transduction histidine kinase
LLLGLFIFVIINLYQKKRVQYLKGLEELKLIHENDMLKSQVEIQEQTFQNISREIHDNIGQKLSLAKLYLNTFPGQSSEGPGVQVTEITKVIGEVISDLSDLSRSMSSEVIKNNGFLKALEFEINQLNKPELFNIKLTIIGEPVFLKADKELILFRIVQEALHNIIKHAQASSIHITLHFTESFLQLTLADNGQGFATNKLNQPNGLLNMKKRTEMLNGQFEIQSAFGEGTTIQIKIPIYES